MRSYSASAYPTKLDDWVRAILVDPLSKETLKWESDNRLLTSYGRVYPIVNMIPDLRLLPNITTPDQKDWKLCQDDYERLTDEVIKKDAEYDYLSEIDGVRAVYEHIPIEGRCLDVGGHQGRLRYFLKPGQEYVSCDPFLHIFKDLEKQLSLLEAYPFLRDPVNFICCDAEHLPFSTASFDVVHMRSVIDHFLNPELALAEAYRVLRKDGALVIGLYVEGGESGKLGVTELLKDAVKHGFETLGLNKYKDYHVWHPHYPELIGLIERSGFSVDSVFWQSENICYVKANRNDLLMRQRS